MLHVLYCHGPDTETPVAEQAAPMDAQFRLGRFDKLGICNFQPDMLKEWLHVADEKEYIKPSVYQGQYNLLCREYENIILPILRQYGMSFFGFSPLAGGYLTGKLTFADKDEELRGTKFEVKETNYVGMQFRKWYDRPKMHDAIRKVKGLCEAHGMEMSEAASRWVMHHSCLDSKKSDEVIIGPRNVEQLAKYGENMRKGPLPSELADELGMIWNDVKADATSIVDF